MIPILRKDNKLMAHVTGHLRLVDDAEMLNRGMSTGSGHAYFRLAFLN